MAFAEEGGDPISEINAVNAGVEVFQKTGLYTFSIREWNKRTQANRTLPDFKTFFTEAERERQAEATATEAGYQQADAATADATAESIATLNQTMTQLIQLVTAQAANGAIIPANNQNSNNPNGRPNRLPNNPNWQRPRPLTDAQCASFGYSTAGPTDIAQTPTTTVAPASAQQQDTRSRQPMPTPWVETQSVVSPTTSAPITDPVGRLLVKQKLTIMDNCYPN